MNEALAGGHREQRSGAALAQGARLEEGMAKDNAWEIAGVPGRERESHRSVH